MNPTHIQGVYVDHINHDTLNNKKSNLRAISNDENTRHRKSRNSNNKSGYRNVFWNTTIEKWQVTLCKDYKRILVGSYSDLEEAGRQAELAREKYYGKFSGEN